MVCVCVCMYNVHILFEYFTHNQRTRNGRLLRLAAYFYFYGESVFCSYIYSFHSKYSSSYIHDCDASTNSKTSTWISLTLYSRIIYFVPFFLWPNLEKSIKTFIIFDNRAVFFLHFDCANLYTWYRSIRRTRWFGVQMRILIILKEENRKRTEGY